MKRATKLSLYVPASPLSLSKQSSSSSWRHHKDMEELSSSLTSNSSDSLASSPRRGAPRPSPTPAIPLHSPSLSTINSSPPDSSIGHHHVRSPELRTSGNPVLMVSADCSREEQEPGVQVTTNKVPSPVKVIRHFPPPPTPPISSVASTDHEKRFSSNFTDFALPSSSPVTRPLAATENRFSSNFTSPPYASKEASFTDSSTVVPVSTDSSTAQHHEQSTIDQSLSLSQHVLSATGQTVIGSPSSSIPQDNKGERRVRVASRDDSVLDTKTTRVAGKMVTSQSADLANILEQNASRPQPKKLVKKGSRVVPSRYMTAAAKKPPQITSNTFTSAATSKSSASAAKSKKTHKPPKASDSFGTSAFCTPGLRPSATTSTPAVAGSPLGLRFDNVSLINSSQGAQSSYNESPPIAAATKGGSKETKTKRKQPLLAPPSSSKSSGTSPSTLLQHRLIQAAYLEVMTTRAQKCQEEQAQAQLTALWEAVEKQKRREAEIMKAVEHEKRMIGLERSLDYQLQGLEPVCEQLTETQPQYTNMIAALDTTRHELPMIGISPLNESELLQQFSELEAQFGDLMSEIREKVTDVSSVASSSQCLIKTAREEHQEMQSTSKEMENAMKSIIHETSLFFEQRQINKALKERNR